MSDRPRVRGLLVDAQTRCAHYHSRVDVIAIKMHCCQTYFACRDCHDAEADHELQPWPASERDVPAVLCGICTSQLTIRDYLRNSSRCPACSAEFNPHCREHHDFYFSST